MVAKDPNDPDSPQLPVVNEENASAAEPVKTCARRVRSAPYMWKDTNNTGIFDQEIKESSYMKKTIIKR